MLTNDVGKDLARLCGLQAQVELLRRLDAFVTENTPDQFVFSGHMLEDQRTSSVPELMNGNAQSRRLLNLVDDLRAE